ncbi:MAG: hypothetical protein IJ692_03525 [Alloprevotella sp.]|nr:hypothetical protein [Alloprevotella sp.]
MKARLLIWLMAAALFSACSKLEIPDEDDPAKPETEQPGTDDPETPPTDGDFLTVAQAMKAENGTFAFVVGYIVGYIDGNSLSNCVFGCPKNAVNTNLILADSPSEKDSKHVLPVSLPTSGEDWRSELNLFDHPQYLGRLVGVTGELTTYFRTIGIRKPMDFFWIETEDEGGGGSGEGGEDDPPSDDDFDVVVIPIDNTGRVVVGR